MIHNDKNEHRCVACGICQMNCPNGTINVVTKQVTDEETGKARKVLDRYEYDLGSCLFCQLCVRTCPHDAIKFINTYEHAVFTRGKLREQLNHEGSTLAKK
jgi:NADH-quinone oxidoreductase subunit I